MVLSVNFTARSITTQTEAIGTAVFSIFNTTSVTLVNVTGAVTTILINAVSSFFMISSYRGIGGALTIQWGATGVSEDFVSPQVGIAGLGFRTLSNNGAASKKNQTAEILQLQLRRVGATSAECQANSLGVLTAPLVNSSNGAMKLYIDELTVACTVGNSTLLNRFLTIDNLALDATLPTNFNFVTVTIDTVISLLEWTTLDNECIFDFSGGTFQAVDV